MRDEADLTLRESFWYRLHVIVNDWAWKHSPPSEHDYQFVGRLWRLNDWLAGHWIRTWSERNPW
jgi:hypothetical protein